MEKRGELATRQIVILVVLIVSFMIILFFFSKLNFGSTSNQEICHNSVVLIDTSASLAGTLDCRTEYVCVSGGRECSDFSETLTIDVDAENETDVMKSLADQMADCWWMFGEGEVDYVDSNFVGDTQCSICSIVGFDEELSGNGIPYLDFYNYLRTAQKTQSQTYLQYLYSTNTLDGFGDGFVVEDYLSNVLSFDSEYFVLTGMDDSFGWGVFAEDHLPVVILEKTPGNYEEIGCDKFLTKA